MDMSDLKLTTRAELQLCLSRTFLPPMREGDFDALRNDLGADLRELNSELEVLPEVQASTLCDALAALPDHETLLKSYSRLFLAPPAPALLSLGFYLDGALMGNSCQAIERLYRQYGLERDSHFCDTADHLALYLQFVGWLLAQAEEHLHNANPDAARAVLSDLNYTITHHGLPAVQRLIAQIHKAESELPVLRLYGQLAILVRQALANDAAAIQSALPRPDAVVAKDRGTAGTGAEPRAHDHPAIACTACDKAFVAGQELETMIAALETHGLTTEHMRICPDCRAGAMGMTPMEAPHMKKTSAPDKLCAAHTR